MICNRLSYLQTDRSWRGFTLTEVLVTIGVLGILASITLPAVMFSLESSRTVTCKSNMRQLGIATNDFDSRFRHFPDGRHPLRDLLKIIDPVGDEALTKMDANARNLPTIFGCPSDHMRSLAYQINSSSYSACQGWRFGPHPQFPLRTNGFSGIERRASEITDGLSNTVAFSERLMGLQAVIDRPVLIPLSEMKKHPLRSSHELGKFYEWGTEELFLNDTREAIQTGSWMPGEFMLHDLGWGRSVGAEEGYNHLGAPNTWRFQASRVQNGYRTIPATSLHSGGVHCLFVDGHVQFIGNSVDLSIWMAVSTIDGGETVPALE